MAVDAPVADEAQHMEFLSLGGLKEVLEYGVLEQTAFLNGQVDLHQILINDAPRAQIHVADFGITHLAIR